MDDSNHPLLSAAKYGDLARVKQEIELCGKSFETIQDDFGG